jgi:cytochrome oxidase Cu insertion factor (SCO1/SenC/PrrC family)
VTTSDLERLLKGSLAVAGLLTLVMGAYALRNWRSPTAADRLGFVALGSVPNFTLTDQQGHPFHSEVLEGKVWVVGFIYTRCTTSCPLITNEMSRLQKRWVKEQDFRLVSITVDPLYDSPAVLSNYAQVYRADFRTWCFLTGPPDQVYDLIEKGFMASVHRMEVEEKGGHVDIPHTTNVVVVDRQGKLRGIFEGVFESDWTRLDTAIAALLKE